MYGFGRSPGVILWIVPGASPRKSVNGLPPVSAAVEMPVFSAAEFRRSTGMRTNEKTTRTSKHRENDFISAFLSKTAPSRLGRAAMLLE
jgi:hypothetical protein